MRPTAEVQGVAYWEQRVATHGRRAVLNLVHGDDEYDAVTERQLGLLMPALQAAVDVDAVRVVVDFGCGPGRFTGALARHLGARAIGVDPIQALLDAAPDHPDVEYRRLREGRIPVGDAEVDVVFVCLVLGGIADEDLPGVAAELQRVLRPGGTLFLVENTAEKADGAHWRFRSQDRYDAMFEAIGLRYVLDYEDADERITAMAGRRA